MSPTDTSQAQKSSRNASLFEYKTDTSNEDETEDMDENKNQVIHGINTEKVDDPHLVELLRELTPNQIDSLLNHFIDKKNIFNVLKEVSDDTDLLENIDTVTQHTVDDTTEVEEAAQAIESKLGSRPFKIEIIDKEREYVKPMLDTDVENKKLTENPNINAKIIDHATRIKASTQNGQYNLTEEWEEAIGEDTLLQFKKNRDPDALGFAHPQLIPATGDFSTRTAITEIPYIGEATAEEIHPQGELMSIEDWTELTYKQATIACFPVEKGYDSREAPGVIKTFIETLQADVTDALGKAMNMMDRRNQEHSNMQWLCGKRQVGILTTTTPFDLDEPINSETVETVEEVEDGTTKLTTNSGYEKYIKSSYWKLLKAAEDAGEHEIKIGCSNSQDPVFIELSDGNYLAASPKNKD